MLLPEGDDLILTAASPEGVTLAADAMAAARWAWTHGEVTGHGTGTLPQTSWRFQPLQGVRGRAGVAGIDASAVAAGSDEERLAMALLDQGPVALERADLAGQALETETLRRADHSAPP